MSAAAIPASELRVGDSRTLKFQGADHGSGVSFFYVDTDPGGGPDLHRHPYTETWLVIEGEATIHLGDDTVVAHEGDTAVVSPHTWHRFTNTGNARLRIVCIHASPTMQQEEAEL